MAVLSKAWEWGKITVDYLVGVVKISLDPAKPIPKTDIHPRMPAHPYSLGEYVRMFPYRHYWKFFPWIRFVVFSSAVFFCLNWKFNNPVFDANKEIIGETIHHIEGSMTYGMKQKDEDVKYFKEHDPYAPLRPRWFTESISRGSLNYFPHGYSTGH